MDNKKNDECVDIETSKETIVLPASIETELKSLRGWVVCIAISLFVLALTFIIIMSATIYSEYIRPKPHSTPTLTSIGNKLYKANKLKKLETLSDKYIKTHPNSASPYYFKMLCAVRRKDYKSAINCLNNVFERNPRMYEQYRHYMEYLKKKQQEKAASSK